MTHVTVPDSPRRRLPKTTADLGDVDFDLAIAIRDLQADLDRGRLMVGRLYAGFGTPLPALEHEIEALEQHLGNLHGLQQLHAAREVLLRRVRAAQTREHDA